MENISKNHLKKLLKNSSDSNLHHNNKPAVKSLKSIKITDIFKNIYYHNSGKAIKNLQKENNLLKFENNNSSVLFNNNSQEGFNSPNSPNKRKNSYEI